MLRNLAVNKPSSQISTYRDQYGQHHASLANDGSLSTDYTDTIHGCAASNPGETNPWWTVDLGAPTLIYQVNFTSRGDDAGYNYNYSYNLNLYSAALQCCPGALNSVTRQNIKKHNRKNYRNNITVRQQGMIVQTEWS